MIWKPNKSLGGIEFNSSTKNLVYSDDVSGGLLEFNEFLHPLNPDVKIYKFDYEDNVHCISVYAEYNQPVYYGDINVFDLNFYGLISIFGTPSLEIDIPNNRLMDKSLNFDDYGLEVYLKNNNIYACDFIAGNLDIDKKITSFVKTINKKKDEDQ
jgi:hypothetical protein